MNPTQAVHSTMCFDRQAWKRINSDVRKSTLDTQQEFSMQPEGSLLPESTQPGSVQPEVNSPPPEVRPESPAPPPQKCPRIEDQVTGNEPTADVTMVSSSSISRDISRDEVEISTYEPSKDETVSEISFSEELKNVTKSISRNED